jgi:hypothetical protein
MSLPEAISWRVDARPRTTKKNTWNVTYKHLLICKFIFSTLYNLKTLQQDIWLKDKVRLIFITSPLVTACYPAHDREAQEAQAQKEMATATTGHRPCIEVGCRSTA